MTLDGRNRPVKDSAPAVMGQIGKLRLADDWLAQAHGCFLTQSVSNHLSLETPWRNITC